MKKVCHITSVHPKEDIRIYKKECLSLSRAGYDVYLVQQGQSYEKGGVHILGFGEIASSRIKRMLFTAKSAYRLSLTADADIYHLHDPELLPYAKKLKKLGKTVVFDSHEDVPASILEKYWIPKPLRHLIYKCYERYENRCVSAVDGVISVTPHICDRLRAQNKNTEMVANFPIIEDDLPTPTFAGRSVVFPGLISEIWNIDVIINAIEPLPGVTLELRCNSVDGPCFEHLKSLPGWKKVNFSGKVPHSEVLKLMSEAICGIALLKPCHNSGWNIGTLGNTKIFEYMMIGIPVVCTNFTLWQQIIDRYDCGICVDPANVDQVQSAIKYLLDNPNEARRMGENGKRAIKEQYNWSAEEKKLLAFYKELQNK